MEYYSNSFIQAIDNFLAIFYEPLVIYKRVTPDQVENIKTKATRVQEFEYFKIRSKIKNLGDFSDYDNSNNNNNDNETTDAPQ